MQLLPCGGLCAIVSPVHLADFETAALRAHLQDAVWLEAMVRRHQRVVEAFHGGRGVLPAKFGCVYTQSMDLASALGRVHDTLLAQLDRVEGCDEWGIRVYADRPTIRRHVSTEDPRVRQIQQELAGARPGRAYFLQRKLADVLTGATDQSVSDLAQAGYDHLLRCAVASQVSPRPSGPHARNGHAEILRAAFLIPHARAASFVQEIHRFMEHQEGLRCEYSGPWPPYSFAALDAEGLR